jgi:serine phosphatase RsbU (regulator of sigma subunit)
LQLSLLPQEIPKLKNFDIGVIYEPIDQVSGDYYDILKERTIPLTVGGFLTGFICDKQGIVLDMQGLVLDMQGIIIDMQAFP